MPQTVRFAASTRAYMCGGNSSLASMSARTSGTVVPKSSAGGQVGGQVYGHALGAHDADDVRYEEITDAVVVRFAVARLGDV